MGDTDQLIESVDTSNEWVHLALPIVIHDLKSEVITLNQEEPSKYKLFLPQNDLSSFFWLFRWNEVFNINMEFFPHRVEAVADHFSPRQVVESPALVPLCF